MNSNFKNKILVTDLKFLIIKNRNHKPLFNKRKHQNKNHLHFSKSAIKIAKRKRFKWYLKIVLG